MAASANLRHGHGCLSSVLRPLQNPPWHQILRSTPARGHAAARKAAAQQSSHATATRSCRAAAQRSTAAAHASPRMLLLPLSEEVVRPAALHTVRRRAVWQRHDILRELHVRRSDTLTES